VRAFFRGLKPPANPVEQATAIATAEATAKAKEEADSQRE